MGMVLFFLLPSILVSGESFSAQEEIVIIIDKDSRFTKEGKIKRVEKILRKKLTKHGFLVVKDTLWPWSRAGEHFDEDNHETDVLPPYYIHVNVEWHKEGEILIEMRFSRRNSKDNKFIELFVFHEEEDTNFHFDPNNQFFKTNLKKSIEMVAIRAASILKKSEKPQVMFFYNCFSGKGNLMKRAKHITTNLLSKLEPALEEHEKDFKFLSHGLKGHEFDKFCTTEKDILSHHAKLTFDYVIEGELNPTMIENQPGQVVFVYIYGEDMAKLYPKGSQSS